MANVQVEIVLFEMRGINFRLFNSLSQRMNTQRFFFLNKHMETNLILIFKLLVKKYVKVFFQNSLFIWVKIYRRNNLLKKHLSGNWVEIERMPVPFTYRLNFLLLLMVNTITNIGFHSNICDKYSDLKGWLSNCTISMTQACSILCWIEHDTLINKFKY